MAVFHLDDNCTYTLDGAPAPKRCERDGVFALGGWKDGRLPATVVVDARDPRAAGLNATDFLNGHFLLSLDLSPATPLCAETSQCSCSGAARHLITARRCEDSPLVVETDGAILSLRCPIAVEKLAAVCARVDGGDLIRVTARGRNIFCALIYHGGGYVPLLTAAADEISLGDDGVVLRDFVGGMLYSTVTRKFKIKDGAFCETERTFDRRDHRYPDGLIGRLYLEKLFYRDQSRCDLVSSSCPVNVDETIGSFDRVFDDDFCGCRRGVYCLAGNEGYCRVRKVMFVVKNGLIEDVRVLP